VGSVNARRTLSALRRRDPGLVATRRAGRVAILGPCGLLVGMQLLGRPALGTFAMLGCIALLAFVDFAGPLRQRVIAQAVLVVTSGALVCLGTLVSELTWLATLVAFVACTTILFAGIVSSVFASATTVLLVSILLPVSLRAQAGAIPDRLLGWLLAGAASVMAIRFCWPAPVRDPLRTLAAEGCARLARQLRVEVDCRQGDVASARLGQLREESTAAGAALRDAFLGAQYPPAGLSTASRALVRVTDRLIWLDRIFGRGALDDPRASTSVAACELAGAAADLLDEGARLLADTDGDPRGLDAALDRLRHARGAMEESVASGLSSGSQRDMSAFADALEPSFRAQETSFVATAIAADIRLAGVVARRSGWRRLAGGRPGEHGSALSSVRQRAAAHLTLDSVWLHNCLRGGSALSLSVLVALLSDAQHAFWLVFGTMAVLRSNAVSTGQSAMRAVIGTMLGIVIGGGLVAIVGDDQVASWALLVPALAMVALAPATISFTAGQASFTVTLLILNNIVTPAGWSAGLVRFEDVAVGVSISAVVGVLLWPRGAGRALGHALAEGLAGSATYLHGAVDFAISRCDARGRAAPAPVDESRDAADVGRRLDDAFRGFVAERGTKRVALADIAALAGGVSLLRLTADAVLELWAEDDGRAGGDRTAARRELAAAEASVTRWYRQVACALAGAGPMPVETSADTLGYRRLTDIARRDLNGDDGRVSATAVKVIWTAGHLDAARRLQSQIAAPAATVASLQAGGSRTPRRLRWGRWPARAGALATSTSTEDDRG
jgi:uncharacterized membrane protein YccC